MKQSREKFYPWVVCGICLLMNVIACGLVTTAFSAYLPFLREEIGLTYTQTSMVNTIRCLVSTVVLLVTTQIYRKISIRFGLLISGLLVAVTCVMFANAHSVWMCYAAAVVMGVVFATGNVIPLSILVRNWFTDMQGTALSISVMGSSVSTAVFPPVITWLIQNAGLRKTFLIETVFIIICMIVIFAVVRDKPQQLGLTPYETGKKKKEKKQHAVPSYRPVGKIGLVLLVLVSLLAGLSGAPYTTHLSLHMITAGIDPMAAAAALSVFGAVMALGKFVFGVSTDRFGAFGTNFLFLLLLIAGTFLVSLANPAAQGMLYPSVSMAGFGLAIGTIGITLWTRDLSDDEKFADRLKISQTVFSLGGLIAGPVPGMIADATGSYAPAYRMFVTIQIMILIVIQILYVKNREKKTPAMQKAA